MAVWAVASDRFREQFAGVVQRVKRVDPSVRTYISSSCPRGSIVFHAESSFYRDPATPQVDVALLITCAPADGEWFADSDGALPFPSARGRHALKFDIERGDGLELAALEAILLPADEASQAYQTAVLEYISKAAVFAEAHINAVTNTLNDARRA